MKAPVIKKNAASINNKEGQDELTLLPSVMKAMVMDAPGQPLICKEISIPRPSAQQVLVKIIACGVCRTDLHIMDNELSHPKLPLIPGHEIVGSIVQVGREVTKLKKGDVIGIPWVGYTCGHCRYCLKGQENLCENALFTGYTINGGYAEYTEAYQDYCFPLTPGYDGPSAAPLLCAGLIGYRAYSMIDPHTERLGIYGFGAAAHILIQVAFFEGKKIYAFTKDGDAQAQAFAERLGAEWARDATHDSPVQLDAAIIFAPVGNIIPKALKNIDKAGSVICGGVHMSNIPTFSYELLWEERVLRSVANLTRADGVAFFHLASKVGIKTETRIYKLEEANDALNALRMEQLQGAAVLVM